MILFRFFLLILHLPVPRHPCALHSDRTLRRPACPVADKTAVPIRWQSPRPTSTDEKESEQQLTNGHSQHPERIPCIDTSMIANQNKTSREIEVRTACEIADCPVDESEGIKPTSGGCRKVRHPTRKKARTMTTEILKHEAHVIPMNGNFVRRNTLSSPLQG